MISSQHALNDYDITGRVSEIHEKRSFILRMLTFATYFLEFCITKSYWLSLAPLANLVNNEKEKNHKLLKDAYENHVAGIKERTQC